MRLVSALRRSPRLQFARRVLGYFWSDRTRILILVGLIGLSTVLGLVLVWPMAILVDWVLTPEQDLGRWSAVLPEALRESRPAQIVALALSTLLLRLLQALVNMSRGLLKLQVSNNGLQRIRCHLFGKLQVLNLQYHRGQPQGDTIYRLTKDAEGAQTILNVFLDIGIAGLTLVVMLGIMFSRSWELTLIAVAVVPLLLLTNRRFERIFKTHSQTARRSESEFTATVQRAVNCIGLMQAFNREDDEYRRFRETVGGSLDAWYDLFRQTARYRFCVGVVFGLGSALIFGYGGYLAYHDQLLGKNPDGMTVGSLMVFLTYLNMFYDPLCKISGAGASMAGGVAGMERVFEVLDRTEVIEEAPEAVPLPRKPRTLTLAETTFAYRPGHPVLKGIRGTIEPGQMVAFVGSSGVGKSTLLNLLPRYFDPTAGGLQLDGYDFRRIKLRDLRRHIAVVPQDSVILPTTVAENIAYGRPDATPAQIRRAAQLAGAHPFIEALPDGYRTEITEGGQNLSGGQRQRIAIARALVTEAPILVLDEPTSALDPETEHLITRTLTDLKRTKTVILVSHRLSTVVGCDRIFVMHDGRIVGRGSHETLLARRGWYYEMARHQLQIDQGALQVA